MEVSVTTGKVPSRTSSCPAWLRYWTPCAEHAHGSNELLDSAILGWREAEKRYPSGSRPSGRYNRETMNHWDCLETMRGIIRGCDDCRCQTASVAAQAALEDAQRPTGNYLTTYQGVANTWTGCAHTYPREDEPDYRAWLQRKESAA